jgi:hypothetical protein
MFLLRGEWLSLAESANFQAIITALKNSHKVFEPATFTTPGLQALRFEGCVQHGQF